jgi:hypothetical protein
MGKLIEKLHTVTQASNSGMGFFGRPRGPERAARPAGVLVSAGSDDKALLTAAAQSGADGVIVTGWRLGAPDLSAVASALAPHEAVLGVQIESDYEAGALKAAQQQGASFAILDHGVAARALFEELEKFDLVATVVPPSDDLALLLLRAVNTLPVQAALVVAGFTPTGLSKLTIADFTRLRLLWESLRFPSLVTLQGPPDAADLRTLVQLGADGVVLPATGSTVAAIGQQVKSLIGQLEQTPARRGESEGGGLLSGLLGASSQAPGAPAPGPGRKPDQPEPEPEEE